MSPARTLALIDNWETRRYELLNSRICELHLRLARSSLEPLVDKVRRELRAKGLRYQPRFYLTDSWGCPDEVPAVGIPFYLADRQLRRVEEEQTGEVEDDATILMLLRHEVGHAVNYAYRLWEDPAWTQTFGSFDAPYRDTFRPDPRSRQFVRHLSLSRYGRSYAQKHPDEDFAETFAVWLTPRSAWRSRYRLWPAIHKLRYVDARLRALRSRPPVRTGGRLLKPVESLTILVAEHYGQRAERYRAMAQGYMDDRLREVFPPVRSGGRPAADLIVRHREWLQALLVRWSSLDAPEVEGIMSKLLDRARALQLAYSSRAAPVKLVALGSLATSLAMDYAYTGRFIG